MPNSEQNLTRMLTAIVRAMCKKTGNPVIRLADGAFTVQVEQADQGRMIGKQGICIWAISTLLWWAGQAQQDKPVTFSLLEPVGGRRPALPPMPFKPESNWDRQVIRDLVEAILSTIFCEEVPKQFTMPPPFVLDESEGDCMVNIRVPGMFRGRMADPSFEEAITVILRSAGFAHGAVIETKVAWV